ncbi:hypothetical protein LPJ78_003496 [Coemansia sp. RSA 989]|nr:hypothetical protein LPJ68_001343 [Coemansia sp. RSA 1086]KAJ1751179.1 hypothetical protein LPJ79_002291 [Coemansia sp. RSA 1821]KAJ1864267.1 hypothetical protein LPJ78_003496 [Coemansia sp. RSA 989]KAJ2676296.1 hypothetical protein IWW42_000584 [Coemansia sp. RSA 1085]
MPKACWFYFPPIARGLLSVHYNPTCRPPTWQDLKKTFDSICAVSGSVGAVMVREDGTIARASGDLRDEDEAYALSNLMKDAAELMSIVQPDSPAITRVTISRQSDVAVVATPHQGHIFGVKLSQR